MGQESPYLLHVHSINTLKFSMLITTLITQDVYFVTGKYKQIIQNAGIALVLKILLKKANQTLSDVIAVKRFSKNKHI